MVDMHIHTNNSDGTYSTSGIIRILKAKKIQLFSITDHDNITSCKDIEEILLPEGMIYIPGIELSATYKDYNCHILGYSIDHKNEDLINECALIKSKRRRKIKQILEYIKKTYGIITEEEEQAILAKEGTISRHEICNVLMKKKKTTRQAIYKKYLSPKGLITHRSKSRKVIEVIHSAGGKAILAHPKEIEEDYKVDIETIILELINQGLDGIEIYNSIHTKEDVMRYIEIAKKYGLLTTGGSDFHGINKPERELGKTTTEKIMIKKSDINFLY